jgi:gamma-glutamyltranspeptidase/glutathione hydrolase
MVVSAESHASDAGVEILAAGGTAVDAAVAVGFALAVTWPTAGNLGGGGFMVIHLADGTERAVDYRERAPAGASRDMYLGADGRPIVERSLVGVLAAGVPGSVAGLCHVQARYGKLGLEEVMAPAIRLAETGFPVSRFLAASLRRGRKLLERFPESRRIFLRGGRPYEAGEVLRQPELAASLRRIAAQGASGFYGGRTAELIAAEMKREGGLVTLEDLRAYAVKERAPLRGSYRGWEIVSMPPPSSGGVALVQMLNILEHYPLARLGPGSERGLHLMAEAMRCAFRDRAAHLGDPDFAEIPVKGLVSEAYARGLRAGIGESAGVSTAMPAADPFAHEKSETTHYSVMDAAGNAVACTTTLNGGYGCGVTVTGAGFLLNNEMDDFSVAPGQPNMFQLIQGEANAIAPSKRPLSSMTPTLVKREGRVMMVIGSPGGPTIINTVLQCIVNVLDHGMDIAQAVAAPRIHHQWLPDRISHEPYGINPDVRRRLEARGHRLREGEGTMGDAHGIIRDPQTGRLEGAADPRGGGAARGL